MRTRPLQELVERVVGALQDGATERLDQALAAEALVRVVTEAGTEQGRGERGRSLLARFAGEPSGFSGDQVRGDVYIALPYSSAVLAYRGSDGRLTERTVFVRFRGELIGELIVYAL